jgi:hypothetical protein
MKKIALATLLTCFTTLISTAAFAVPNPASVPLAPSTAYSITLSKLSAAGALVDLETVTGTTDADGKLAFTLSSVPTKDDANFVVITIRDGSSTVVRRGVAPAPPANDNNAAGLNFLSTTQADGLLRALALSGTDDPIVVAYMLIILRTPGISSQDLDNLAILGQDALTTGGPDNTFEGFLTANAGALKLASLKSCLVYNPDNTKKTLRDFARRFYDAVDMTNDNAATAEMQKAGGLMGEIFLDAGVCAGIDAGQILAAHNAAGDGANGGAMAALTPGLRASIDAGMSAFNKKIAMVRITTEYTNALATLGASGDQVTQFLGAVNSMMLASAQVDATYGQYFQDRAAYLSAHPGADDNSVQQAINDAYSAAWSGFQTDIAVDNAAIAAMKSGLEAANPGLELPPGFGTWTDFTGTPKNWPIPQVVLVNWMAGSSFAYSPRDNTAIPAMMGQWMGTCSNPMFWDNNSCTGNGGTWTPGRRTYDTGFPVFDSYLGLQEDLNIIQMKRNEIWNGGGQPTGAQRAANESAYVARVLATITRISGSKGGSPITAQQKGAIVKLLLQPQE